MSLIAVAQFAPGTDKDANLTAMAELAEAAVARGATLVVFPEYSSFFEPVLGDASIAAAEPLDGPFVTSLTSVAQRLRIHVVAGLLETADATHVHNTVVAIAPTGSIVADYRKLHLYDAFGQRESDRVTPGAIEAPRTFSWEGHTVGLQTCYDIRFPEVTRRLVDAGATLVIVPAEWVRGPLKEHHWRTLVTARAIENTIYVAAADHAPPIGVGTSMIVDPMGVELATIGEESAAIAVAEVSLDRIESVRAVNPALGLRRFGIAEPPQQG